MSAHPLASSAAWWVRSQRLFTAACRRLESESKSSPINTGTASLARLLPEPIDSGLPRRRLVLCGVARRRIDSGKNDPRGSFGAGPQTVSVNGADKDAESRNLKMCKGLPMDHAGSREQGFCRGVHDAERSKIQIHGVLLRAHG